MFVAGPLEEVKTEVCSIMTRFAQRFTEEFEQFLTPCVEEVLNMLKTTTLEAYCDGVVSAGMKFLGSGQ